MPDQRVDMVIGKKRRDIKLDTNTGLESMANLPRKSSCSRLFVQLTTALKLEKGWIPEARLVDTWPVTSTNRCSGNVPMAV